MTDNLLSFLPDTCHFNEVRAYLKHCKDRNHPVHMGYLAKAMREAKEGYKMYKEFKEKPYIYDEEWDEYE
jgi:hypothetical protein